jgi:hypothetical protein
LKLERSLQWLIWGAKVIEYCVWLLKGDISPTIVTDVCIASPTTRIVFCLWGSAYGQIIALPICLALLGAFVSGNLGMHVRFIDRQWSLRMLKNKSLI